MQRNDEKLGILPNLTKDYILSKVSQERIFERYLGINVDTNGLFTAPASLRAGDRKPTCSFYYNEHGKLRLRDWAGYFWGDCFDLVGYITHVSVKSKQGFNVVLDHIARDFRLHKYEGKFTIDTGSTFSVSEAITKVKRKTTIQFQTRGWQKHDAEFWKAGNISSRTLEIGRVFACSYVWVNNHLIYNYLPQDPAYAYYFNENEIKIYFPNRAKGRFITNTSYLQGKDLVVPQEFGIITKSYKDVLALREFGITAVAPGAESILITKEDWFNLKFTCNHWFSLMDFDRQGVVMSNKLRKIYGIHPLFLCNRKLLGLQKEYIYSGKAKDFYDFVKIKGVDETKNLINNFKSSFEDTFDNYNNVMRDNLRWLITTN